MWQQLRDHAVALRGQAGQHIFEIRVGVMPVELGTLDPKSQQGCRAALASSAAMYRFHLLRLLPRHITAFPRGTTVWTMDDSGATKKKGLSAFRH